MREKALETTTFSEIKIRDYFRFQPEGFLMQKMSAIHYLPVQAGCKYRAFLMKQKEKVHPA